MGRYSLSEYEYQKLAHYGNNKQPRRYKPKSKSTFKPKNIPKQKVYYGTKEEVRKQKWLDTHREYLRWRKTPEFAKWRSKQFLKQGGRCYYCDEPLKGIQTNIEHIIPKIRGGDNRKSNLVIACWVCNKNKYTDMIPLKTRKKLKEENSKKRGTWLTMEGNPAYMSDSEHWSYLQRQYREDF